MLLAFRVNSVDFREGDQKKKDEKKGKKVFALSGTQIASGTNTNTIDDSDSDTKVNYGMNKGGTFYTPTNVHAVTKKVPNN